MNEDYLQVRIYFNDDSTTIMHVHIDDNITDEIVDLCEGEGWDISTVTDYKIIDETN